MTRTIVVAGAGGVGKTTISAALGVQAATGGSRTLVLTVDPAKRLANALGVSGIAGEPAPTGVEGLDAAMLDATASWTNVIRRHAPPDVAERLVTDDFFAALAERFPSSQAYAAAEEMTSHVESGRWDLVIVDTPPAAGGLEFMTAPQSITELIGGNALRWLTGSGSRLGSLARRRAIRLADSALGSDLLERVSSFLGDLRTLYDGLADRATDIETVLGAADAVLVTSARPTPLREVDAFLSSETIGDPVAVVFNRTLPSAWIGADGIHPLMDLWSDEASRQHAVIDDFAATHRVPTALVPWQASPPTDADALRSLLTGTDLASVI